MKHLVDDDEMELIRMIRESSKCSITIDIMKEDTEDYICNKGYDGVSWKLFQKYPDDDKVLRVIKCMEKQIEEITIKKEMINARITNWIKNHCGI